MTPHKYESSERKMLRKAKPCKKKKKLRKVFSIKNLHSLFSFNQSLLLFVIIDYKILI